MSHPVPGVQPSYPPPPPTGPQGRSRLPWVVAAAAAAVALAAVVALVVVLVGGDDPEEAAGGGSERTFDTPEDAVAFMVESLADQDAGRAAEAFAVTPVVEGWDFEAQAERLSLVGPTTWLPDGHDGYDSLNEQTRRGEVAGELRSVIRSILLPDDDPNVTRPLSDGDTAADVLAEQSPEGLSELSLARVDDLDRDEEAHAEVMARQAAVYDADEMLMIAMLLDTADGQAMLGATAVRYDDRWALMSLSAPLLNLPLWQAEPTTEQDYLDAVDVARGTD